MQGEQVCNVNRLLYFRYLRQKKTIVCDTPILSGHIALCTIQKEETNPLKLVEKKKIYDRSTYNKEKFLDDLKKANWSVIYEQKMQMKC